MSNTAESIKKELADYQGKIGQLNKQLEDLESQKQNILRVGTRLEGIVAYLTAKLKELETDVTAAVESALDTPPAPAPVAPAAEPVGAQS